MVSSQKTFLLGLGILAAASLSAHAAMSYSGGTATENFDGLLSTGSVVLATGSAGATAATSIAGTTFDGAGAGNGGTAASIKLVADTGTGNSGALYSYGASGSSDRALGSLASGSVVGAFGVDITNTGTNTYSAFIISFDSEEFRPSTSVQNTLTFAYGTSASGMITSSNYLAVATGLTPDSDFDIVGTAPVTTQTAVFYSTLVTGTLPVSLAPGESLFLSWTDTNDAGNDAGLAIDNFTITGTSISAPEPASLGILGVAGIILFRRRSK